VVLVTDFPYYSLYLADNLFYYEIKVASSDPSNDGSEETMTLLLLAVGLVTVLGVCSAGGRRADRAVWRAIEIVTVVTVLIGPLGSIPALSPKDIRAVRKLFVEGLPVLTPGAARQAIEDRRVALLAPAEEAVCHRYPLGLDRELICSSVSGRTNICPGIHFCRL